MAHFLVVEDFPPMASVLTMAIRREGHKVARAGSVAAALALEESFEHAVLDIDLPDGNGVDLAERLLADGKARGVLFFTACRDVGLLERAASLGLVVDKAAGYDCLMAATRRLVTPGLGEKRVAIMGSANTIDAHEPGRSGTRRKFEP